MTRSEADRSPKKPAAVPPDGQPSPKVPDVEVDPTDDPEIAGDEPRKGYGNTGEAKPDEAGNVTREGPEADLLH